MGRYNSDTLWRVYQIGGADLALRYAEIASRSEDRPERTESETTRELEIVDLRFFTGGPHKPAASARIFGSRFPSSTTQYVYYQVDLRHPWRYASIPYTISARYYHADGSRLIELTDEFETRPEEPLFSRARGCGREEAGNWTPGTYRVEVEIGYRKTRSAEFTIFDDQAERLAEVRQSLFGALSKPAWEFSATGRELPGKPPEIRRRKKR